MHIPHRPEPPLNRTHCQDECPLSATGPPASDLRDDGHQECEVGTMSWIPPPKGARNLDELGADLGPPPFLGPGSRNSAQTYGNKDAAFEKTTKPKEPARVSSKGNTRDDARDYKRRTSGVLFASDQTGSSVQISSARRPLLRDPTRIIFISRLLLSILLLVRRFRFRRGFLSVYFLFFSKFKNATTTTTTKSLLSSSHCSLAP
jgi:hypothetical protein